jgi:hypothetical protein
VSFPIFIYYPYPLYISLQLSWLRIGLKEIPNPDINTSYFKELKMILQKKIKELPFYIFLFPLFFVFHGFNTNFYFVSLPSAWLLVAVYTFWSLIIAGLFYIFSRRWQHAAFMAAFVMAFDFFFGNIQDTIKENIPYELATKYSFLIIVFLILAIALFFLLRKKQLSKLTFYLNTLFIVLIIFEVFSLLYASVFKQ